MTIENAASAATAKPCLDDATFHCSIDIGFVERAGNAVVAVLDKFLHSASELYTFDGQFDAEGDEDVKDLVCDIVAARVGLADIIRMVAEGREEILAAERKLVDPCMSVRAVAALCGTSISEIRDIYSQTTGVTARMLDTVDLQTLIRGLIRERLRVSSVLRRRTVEETEREWALVEPAPSANPEAAAHARYVGRSAGRDRAEAIFNFEMLPSGRQFSMRGNPDDINSMIRAGRLDITK